MSKITLVIIFFVLSLSNINAQYTQVNDHTGVIKSRQAPLVYLTGQVVLTGFTKPNGAMTPGFLENGFGPTSSLDTFVFDGGSDYQGKWIPVVGWNQTIKWLPGEADLVQYVLVDNPTNPTRADYKMGKLDSAGNFLELDGSQGISFYGLNEQSFYLLICNLNHNGVMSSVPITFGNIGDTIDYNFTTSYLQFWGGWTGCEYVGGKYGLIPGDYAGYGYFPNPPPVFNTEYGDNFTDLSDMVAATNDMYQGWRGFPITDLNRSGFVDRNDSILATVYWYWGSAIPFVVSTGEPLPYRRVQDYNMNGRIDHYDRMIHTTPPRKLPAEIDYNKNGHIDREDRLLGRMEEIFSGITPNDNPSQVTYDLEARAIVSSHSIVVKWYLTQTGDRFLYKGGQFFFQINSDDFTVSNAVIDSSIVPSILSTQGQRIGVGQIISADPIPISENGTFICQITISGNRQPNGGIDSIIRWRDFPLYPNPYTKIVAYNEITQQIEEITQPDRHFMEIHELVGVSVNTYNTSEYRLSQNYPNPFNPITKISFSIPKPGMVRLTIFDVLGREVTQLLKERLTAGAHEINFNGSNLTTGTYFYRLETEGLIETKKMILMK